MSLFLCENCGCIENTNLVHANVDTNPAYPNMWLMDMQGHGGHVVDLSMVIISETTNNESIKKNIKQPDEILMLCSECNTGLWHGEFERVLGTDNEKAIAKLSKYNAITPYDHPEGSLIKDDTIECGYKINNAYDGIIKKG